jgi:glycosyltransferase involved in cell wall biosynthesis
VLAGGGPQRDALARRAAAASVPVHLVEEPSDALLYALYQRAAALVFPAVEDFGMMPVEAMAAGTPVIGVDEGGLRESVVPGTTGVLLPELTAVAFRNAVSEVEHLPRAAIAASARRFSVEAFQDRIRAWVREELEAGR